MTAERLAAAYPDWAALNPHRAERTRAFDRIGAQQRPRGNGVMIRRDTLLAWPMIGVMTPFLLAPLALLLGISL